MTPCLPPCGRRARGLPPACLAALAALPAAAFAQAAQTAAAQQLPTVVVNASADASAAGLTAPYAGGQVARGGRVGLLGTLDVMETPFSTTAYTQALIQDQQAQSIAEVLQNDPTVRVARGFGNFQQLYVVRGFPVYSDDMSYNGLYGLLPRQYLAAEFVERVEVLRGASALLNGAAPGGSGIGGAINIAPKRAPASDVTAFALGAETGGQGYLAADVSRRFGADRATGLRLNVVRRDGGTAVQREHRELSAAAVGLDWRGARARLSADVGWQEQKLRDARPSVDVAAGLAVPLAPRGGVNFGQPWTYSNGRDAFGTVRGEFDLSSSVTAWAAVGGRRGNESSSLQQTTVIDAAGTTRNYRGDFVREDRVATGEAGVRARLRTGGVGHTLVAAATTHHFETRAAYGFSNFLGGFFGNLYRPVEAAAPPADFFTGGALGSPGVTQKTRTSSLAVADTLSLAGDSVLVTLGLRRQRIEDTGYDYNTGVSASNYDKSRTSPAVAALWKATRQVSVYANHVEGLAKGPVAGGTALNAGEVFAPYVAKQTEAGVKLDGGRVGGGLAVFQTTQPSAVTANNVTSVSGQQRNRGAELSVFGEAARGVRLLGGLTWLDAKQTRTQGGATDGRDAIGAPRFQANLGAEWLVPGTGGLVLTGRAVHTASQYADAANTQRLPSWTRLDLGARYTVAVAGRALTLRARVDNAADRSYWATAGGYPGTGYLVLGTPRTFVVSGTVDF